MKTKYISKDLIKEYIIVPSLPGNKSYVGIRESSKERGSSEIMKLIELMNQKNMFYMAGEEDFLLIEFRSFLMLQYSELGVKILNSGLSAFDNIVEYIESPYCEEPIISGLYSTEITIPSTGPTRIEIFGSCEYNYTSRILYLTTSTGNFSTSIDFSHYGENFIEFMSGEFYLKRDDVSMPDSWKTALFTLWRRRYEDWPDEEAINNSLLSDPLPIDAIPLSRYIEIENEKEKRGD